VSETGAGMTEAVKSRALEPWFSTKGETGPGLRLSMVFGVMARHGGDMALEREEGKGNDRHAPDPSGDRVPVETVVPVTERSPVLLVDDNETLHIAVGDMLRGASYAVTLAGSGLEGVSEVRERDHGFESGHH
jgi:signal transduction histidine kinase